MTTTTLQMALGCDLKPGDTVLWHNLPMSVVRVAEHAPGLWRATLHSPEQGTQSRVDDRFLVTADGLTGSAAGLELPKAALDLCRHAEAHGWDVRLTWRVDMCGDGTPDQPDHPYLDVEVGREADGGRHWWFRVTWHTHVTIPGPAGPLRLRGSGLCRTPENMADRDAPSLRKIREIIGAHPVPGGKATA